LQSVDVALQEAAITVTVGELPIIQASRHKLTQLFQNLIENAVKYRRSDVESKIHIDSTEYEDRHHFSVEDNGIGIESKYLHEVFHVFRRVSPRSDIPGTGVGLAICKRIVELHGGRIWVESQVGRGSVFNFEIAKYLRSLIS
jgi:light-regulated signal transduction histidine kinase (bacteriophytochrome)